jgi:hypothetical protein
MKAKRRPRRPRRIAASLLLLVAGGSGIGSCVASAPLPRPSRVDGGLRCSADQVLRPLSTRDVSRMLTELHAESAASGGNHIRVRATHARFHTPSTLACPGDQQAAAAAAARPSSSSSVATASSQGADTRSALGTATDANPIPPSPRRVSLLTDALDAVLEVLPAPKLQMRVQAGMTVGQLLAAASAVNMSLPLGALPSFAGLTLGGALAAAAHGSGPVTLADMVVEATWVDGTGRVRNTSSSSAAAASEATADSGLLSTRGGRALIGGLGMTGVVTELVLQLTPPTLTHALVALDAPDDNLAADVRDLLQMSSSSSSSPSSSQPQPSVTTIVWRPDLKRYSAWVLLAETERDAERRRRRERRQWLAGAGGGQPPPAELSPPEDARLTAAPGVEAALPPAAARSLLAWQRDANLQGGAREEAAACALARAGALTRAPFGYPPTSAKVVAAQAKAEESSSARSGSGGALGLLRLGRRRRAEQPAATTQDDADLARSGARRGASSRLSLAFAGRTNDMAASACAPDVAPSAAAAKRGAPPLCAWGGGGGGGGDSTVLRAVRGSGFHLAIDLDDLDAWVEDARWALEADLQQDPAIPAGEGRCLPPGGFVLRFGAGMAEEEEKPTAGEGGEEAAEAEEQPPQQQGEDDDDEERRATDARMDLAAPPDPAQLAPKEDEEQLLLPPALVVVEAAGGGGGSNSTGSSSGNGTASVTAAAPSRVVEVEEASAAGLLSPASGLRRPVYVQALAATLEEEGGPATAAAAGPSAASSSFSTPTIHLPPPTTKYGWVLDALERFTLCAYPRAAPHWGDSSERALMTAAGEAGEACPGRLATRFPWFQELLEAQREFDPLGMFEPELFGRVKRIAAAEEAAVVARGAEAEGDDDGASAAAAAAISAAAAPPDEDGCAATGRCYCREARHCAPGFGCVESNAFAGVMVCKPWSVIAAMETGPAPE